MSEKCLYCQTPIQQKEGKRERKFCTPSHCTMYHLKNKNKDKPKGQRGRPSGAKNKSTVVGAVPLPKDYVEFTDIGVNDNGKVKLLGETKVGVVFTDVNGKQDAVLITSQKPKWDFSKVVFLNVEEFTEYPKSQCPPNGYQRSEYLSKKKEADDKIREAWNKHKSQ